MKEEVGVGLGRRGGHGIGRVMPEAFGFFVEETGDDGDVVENEAVLGHKGLSAGGKVE